MNRRLRAPSPALVISLIALFVALGGTTAYGSGLISGRQIANHSIPANKLTPAAVNALQGERGPAGPGAISLSASSEADSVRHFLTTTHWVTVSFACDGNSKQIRFFLTRRHHPGRSVSISGFYAQDGEMNAVTHSGVKHEGLAGGTLNVSVIAGTGDDGGLSRIDLNGAYYGLPVESGGDYCAVSGLITPGT